MSELCISRLIPVEIQSFSYWLSKTRRESLDPLRQLLAQRHYALRFDEPAFVDSKGYTQFDFLGYYHQMEDKEGWRVQIRADLYSSQVTKVMVCCSDPENKAAKQCAEWWMNKIDAQWIPEESNSWEAIVSKARTLEKFILLQEPGLPEEPEGRALWRWFDYFEAARKVIKITLKDIAKKTHYSYGYVRNKHSDYKAETGTSEDE